MWILRSKQEKNGIGDIYAMISDHKAEEGKMSLKKWTRAVPHKNASAHYETIGHYDSVQDALNVAATLCFLGEIEYGY